MHKRFVVLGSNSFSGSHFTEYLLKQGHHVLGISRSAEPEAVFLPYKGNQNYSDLFDFFQGDLNLNHTEIVSLIRDFSPEYVVNFAAQGMVVQSWDTPEDWYRTNVVAQVRLHGALRTLASLKKYVHVTTPEVYGSTSSWITESNQFFPSTPYAVSRASCDMHLMSFYHAYEFPVVFTRAANVYGPGQQLYRIIPRALICARTGQKLKLHGGGESIRCFIYIDDVAEAIYQAALRGKPGQCFHISTKEKTAIKGLVERIAELTGVAFPDLAEISDERLGKDQAYLLNSSKLRQELAWTDTIGLEEGVVKTLEWVDENLETLLRQPQAYVHKP
jgi:dTDP-glucose 4,6-dehydratase